MTNRLFRKHLLKRKLGPMLDFALLCIAFYILGRFNIGVFVFFLLLLGIFVILTVINIFFYICGINIGQGKECMKAYGIDRKDLDEDMKNAENIDDLYMGRKYFYCAGAKPLIIPIKRMIVVHPKTLVLYNEAFDDIYVYANAVTTYVIDDEGTSRIFEMYKKKEKPVEERVEHFKKVMKIFQDADPAILTPLDHEFFEWINRFSENFEKAKKIVDQKRGL